MKGALPDNYFSRLNFDASKLAALLDRINKIDTLLDKQQDIVERVYEYFLSKFTIVAGKREGRILHSQKYCNPDCRNDRTLQ